MVAAVTTLAGDPSAQIDAGNMSTINTVIAAVASMALPAVFATFCKNLRVPVITCALITGVCFAVVFFLPYGPLTWVCFLIQPLAMASIMPFVKMAPTLLPNVKREDLGAIGGIQATFQNLGMSDFSACNRCKRSAGWLAVLSGGLCRHWHSLCHSLPQPTPIPQRSILHGPQACFGQGKECIAHSFASI